MLISIYRIIGRLTALILLLFFTVGWNEWNVELVGEVETRCHTWSLDVVGNFVYLADQTTLRVYDISTPEESDEIQIFEINAMRTYALGEILVVTLQNGGIALYDISDPASPEYLSTFPNWLIFYTPAIYENLLYLDGQRAGTDGIFILDVSDPEHPDSVGFMEWEGWVSDLNIQNETLYITHFNGFSIYGLENPLQPDSIVTCDTLSRAKVCRIVDNTAYIASSGGVMWVLDISDPEELEILDRSDVGGNIYDMVIDDSLAYIAGASAGLRIWDLHDLNHIEEIGWYRIPVQRQHSGYTKTWSLDYADGLIFVAYCFYGLKICNFNERGSTVLVTPDHFNFPTLESGEQEQRTMLLRNHGHLDQLITEILPREGIFSVNFEEELLLEPYEEVELTLTFEPEEPGEFYDTLSVTVEDFDPPPPVPLFGSCTEMEEVYHEDLFSSVYYCDIDEDYCYVSGNGVRWFPGFFLLDVSDPDDPRFLDSLQIRGRWGTFGAATYFNLHDDHLYAALYDWMDWNLYDHAIIDVSRDGDEFGRVNQIELWGMGLGEYDYISAVHRTDRYFIACGSPGLWVMDYQENDLAFNEGWRVGSGNIEQLGEYFCFSSYENRVGGVVIIDLEDIDNPELISRMEVGPGVYDIEVFENIVFAAADDLYIFDFSNPEEPEQIDVLRTPGNARHMDIEGNLLYLADETSVRVYNISEPDNISLAAVNFIPSWVVAGREEHLFTFARDGNLWVYDMSEIIEDLDRVPELEVNLVEGWNLISLNISPPQAFYREGEDRGPDVIRMMAQLRIDEEHHHVLLTKNEDGNFYLPSFDFNNIPYWNLTEGYQVKVDEDVEAVWAGEPIPTDSDIPLSDGWNFIAYYPTYELDASAPDFYVLSPIIDNVLIAKNNDGEFMLPEFNFSNMTPWRETQGYQVKVDADVVLNYPEEGEIVNRQSSIIDWCVLRRI